MPPSPQHLTVSPLSVSYKLAPQVSPCNIVHKVPTIDEDGKHLFEWASAGRREGTGWLSGRAVSGVALESPVSPGVVLTSTAIYVMFARPPLDPVGFHQVFCILLFL